MFDEFVFWTVAFFVNGWGCILFHRMVQQWWDDRQDKKFLRHLQIEHPDSIITITAVSTTDKDALNQIKEQLNGYR